MTSISRSSLSYTLSTLPPSTVVFAELKKIEKRLGKDAFPVVPQTFFPNYFAIRIVPDFPNVAKVGYANRSLFYLSLSLTRLYGCTLTQELFTLTNARLSYAHSLTPSPTHNPSLWQWVWQDEDQRRHSNAGLPLPLCPAWRVHHWCVHAPSLSLCVQLHITFCVCLNLCAVEPFIKWDYDCRIQKIGSHYRAFKRVSMNWKVIASYSFVRSSLFISNLFSLFS